MICHEKRAILIHIPKTGGTSIEVAMDAPGHDFRQCEWKHESPCDLIWEYGQDIWDDYFKFTFVRNPWDRALSWYFFRCQNRQVFFGSFRNFVHRYYSKFSVNHSMVAKTQVSWLDEKSFDLVGRFESLHTDWQRVCKKIGVQAIELPWKVKTFHRHYSYYYDDELRKMVGDWFRDDVETFGYEFEFKPSTWGYSWQ